MNQSPHIERIISRTATRAIHFSDANEADALHELKVRRPELEPAVTAALRAVAGADSTAPSPGSLLPSPETSSIASKQYARDLPPVTIKDDEFESSIRLTGKENLLGAAPRSGDIDRKFSTYLLRSWIDKKTGSETHQLYVSHYYSGEWIFWHRASAADVGPLEFVSISRKVITCGRYLGCSYVEVMGATIQNEILVKSVASGLRIKFFARTGEEMVVTVPADQIAAQIAAINKSKPRRS